MTTTYHDDVTCAHCGATSRHEIVASTNAIGSADLDFRPPQMQRSTMRMWLQVCPECGLCAPDLARPGPIDGTALATRKYRARLDDPRFPELACRFRARALLVEESGPAEAARAYLCAAWACDDAGLGEQAVECCLAAADAFGRLRPFPDTKGGVSQGAVLVDVLRRAARFEEAASECRSLLARRSLREPLRQIAEYQQRLIAARDPSVHTAGELAGARAGGGRRWWRRAVPAEPFPKCPYCRARLRTARARQCFRCGMDWHDPANIVRRGGR